jgi:protein-arginine kinase activator protein McsA
MDENEYTYDYIVEFTEQQYIKYIESLDNDGLLNMIKELNLELIECENLENYEECCIIRDDINQLKQYLL